MEITFEIPRSNAAPLDTMSLSQYFKPRSKACKILSSKAIEITDLKTPSKEDTNARKLNEYKRILGLAIKDHPLFSRLLLRGHAGAYLELRIKKLVPTTNSWFAADNMLVVGFACNGHNITIGGGKLKTAQTVNLAVPNAIDELKSIINTLLSGL
jgi:hypothetical protein